MKPAQTPIYRAIERLMQWFVAYTTTLPKSLPMRVIGEQMLADVKTCMDAVAAAVITDRDDAARRVHMLDVVIVKMTAVKTAMRILSQYRNGQTPVLSTKQYAAFLDLANSVATQAGAWRNKTAQVVH